jgi:hypothetical protein
MDESPIGLETTTATRLLQLEIYTFRYPNAYCGVKRTPVFVSGGNAVRPIHSN